MWPDCNRPNISPGCSPVQGSEPAERAAVAAAGAAARGATAYLNLESGDCHGDLDASAGALVAAGERTPMRCR
jgi:diaminohydroxyphosphoribosylaminopyrimidine deaminase/5-amino-6-(5-phosphoribosylamino)uracil reductase